RTADATARCRTLRVHRRLCVRGIVVLVAQADLRELALVLEPEVRPRLAGIGRAGHTVAVRYVAADAALAHAHVDHVRVGLRDRDRTDGRALEESVGRVLPVLAAIHRLPHAAAGRAEIEGVAIPRIARNGTDPTAAIRARATPFEPIEEVRGFSRSRGRTARGRRGTTFCWHELPPRYASVAIENLVLLATLCPA